MTNSLDKRLDEIVEQLQNLSYLTSIMYESIMYNADNNNEFMDSESELFILLEDTLKKD